jgi:hypothetical protein
MSPVRYELGSHIPEEHSSLLLQLFVMFVNVLVARIVSLIC